MAWETRKRGGRYYCRSSRRADGSVRREYIGTGPRAEQISEQDRLVREQRRKLQREVAELEAKVADAAQLIKEVSECTEVMLAANLLAAGFRHYKSQWRRRRDRNRKTDV
jgi:hypothetical protein